MQNTNTKRFLSLLMALLMVISLVPGHAMAAETDAAAVQAEIDRILTTYLGTTDMAAQEVRTAVEAMEDYWPALIEVDDLENSEIVLNLTEAELQTLLDTNATYIAFAEALYARRSNDSTIAFFATTVTALSDASGNALVTVTDSAGTGTVSNGTVTTTVKSSSQRATNTVTITNASDSTATLSFDYNASNLDTSTTWPYEDTPGLIIDGVDYSTSNAASYTGSFSKIMDAGTSITITYVSPPLRQTATLTLSNFSLVEAKTSSDVTIQFDSTLGSVTAAGNAVSSGDGVSVDLTESLALVAAPASGTTFYGWVDASTRAILTTDTSYTLTTGNDITVEAIFAAAGSTYFAVGSASEATWKNGIFSASTSYYHTVSKTHIFDSLSAATAAAAASSNSKVVIPLSDVTLTGANTIPAGVTLLIPFDEVYSMYTTEAQTTGTDVPATVVAHRTLTLAEGASLTVNGAVSLSAKHCYTATTHASGSSPSGNVSFINMGNNSTITINNGGALYAYGYIIGSGSVIAESGATVYENFQIADFRGGTVTTDSGMKNNKVFPMSQYYVQNIEVPLTLKYGAKEYVFSTIFMSSAEFPTAAEFIGSNGLFRLSESTASITKSYDGSTDRLSLEVSGDGSLSSFTLSVGGTELNTADYVLPLNNNITITLNSGSDVTLNQAMAFIPGTQLFVSEGASLTLGSGTNVYVYDSAEWGTYCSNRTAQYIPLHYAPGRTYNRQISDLVDAIVQVDGTLNASAGALYTTAGGANICSTGTGVVTTTAGADTITYQASQASTNVTYVEIPITPAKLKHGDGTYAETTDASSTTYNYINTFWHAGSCTDSESDTDHNCDVCNAELSTCADTNNDHNCDVCSTELSDCADDDNNHLCDVCSTELSQCADDDNNHNCDVCGTKLSDCADNNNNHLCDVCNAELSQCADDNNNHLCDVCNAELSQCADDNNNHLCDVCNAELSQCADDDSDHLCDICNAELSQCADDDNDHLCDVCNAELSQCTDISGDQDHNCDICGAENITECSDSEDDNDHNCDECDTKLGECADNDSDNTCDDCGAVMEESVEFLYTAKTLFLKGAVSINVYLAFEGPDFLTQEYILANGGLLVWNDGELPANAEEAVYGTESYIANMEYSGPYGAHIEYIATSEGIPAKEYGDTIYFRSYMLVDGEYQYGEIQEYGVKTYCEGRFEKSSNTELKSALVALLNFGAEAQTYMSYETDNLVNADMQTYLDNGWITADMVEMGWDDSYLDALDEPSAEMTVNFAQTESLSDISRSLFLKGAISVNYYVTIGQDAGTFADATVKTMYFWTAEDYAALEAAGTVLSKENASYSAEADFAYSNSFGWEYSVMSDPIAAKNWGDTLYAVLCVTDSEGTEHCTGVITYSPDQYAYNKLNDNKVAAIDSLVQWMAVYSERAIVYFS